MRINNIQEQILLTISYFERPMFIQEIVDHLANNQPDGWQQPPYSHISTTIKRMVKDNLLYLYKAGDGHEKNRKYYQISKEGIKSLNEIDQCRELLTTSNNC